MSETSETPARRLLREVAPEAALIAAMRALEPPCVNRHAIEAEARRRRERVDSLSTLAKAAGDIADIDSIEALGSRGSAIPEGMRSSIERVADDLTSAASEAERAVRAGGADALDRATGTNSDGLPRSLELVRLCEKTRALASDLRFAMSMPDMAMDDHADRLKALDARFREVADELRAVGSMPRPDDLAGSEPEGSGVVPKPDGWTRAELIDQANHNDDSGSKTLSETTFDRIRDAAGIPAAKRGGAGAQRRFSVGCLRKLICATEKGTYRNRHRIAEAWRELLPS